MRNTYKLSFIAFVLVVFITACGKETQSSTQGGGVFKIKAKISPALQFGQNGTGGVNSVSLGISGGSTASWGGTSASSNLSEITTDELSVTTGQNITSLISLSNGYDQVCRTITLEGIQNGKVVKTYTLNMGISKITVVCPDNNLATKNFIAE